MLHFLELLLESCIFMILLNCMSCNNVLYWFIWKYSNKTSWQSCSKMAYEDKICISERTSSICIGMKGICACNNITGRNSLDYHYCILHNVHLWIVSTRSGQYCNPHCGTYSGFYDIYRLCPSFSRCYSKVCIASIL